jgi:hypothetical protein
VPLGVVVPNIHLLHPPNLSACRSSMTIDTVELRKIQYAQELAAYTMRQWMLMRDDPESQQGSVPASATSPTSSTQNSATSTGRLTRDNVNRMCPSADLRSAGYVCSSRTASPHPLQALVLPSGTPNGQHTHPIFISLLFQLSVTLYILVCRSVCCSMPTCYVERAIHLLPVFPLPILTFSAPFYSPRS